MRRNFVNPLTRIAGVGLASLVAAALHPPSASLRTQRSRRRGPTSCESSGNRILRAAYNRGDAKAVASQWSDSGEWISPAWRSGSRKGGHPEGTAKLVCRKQKCPH